MSRYIDAEWLMNFFVDIPNNFTLTIGNLRATVNDAPSIDIVRCQDCRYRYMDADLQVWTCTYGLMIKPDGFCNYGEVRDE